MANAQITPMPQSKETLTVSQKQPRSIYSLYTSEFSSLDAERVKSYLESARKGLNFWKALLFDEIRRRDAHIGAVCQTRKLAVAAAPFEIECEDEKLKEYIETIFDKFNFVNFITDCVEASIQGMSLFEINYSPDPVLGAVPDTITLIPNHLVMYDENLDEYKLMDIERADYWSLRAVASNTANDSIPVSLIPQVSVDPLKLLECHAFDGNSRNGLLNGCIDSLIWMYFFKSYGIKDWATYLERYATPTRIGKYDDMAGVNPVDKASFLNAVKEVGHNSYCVIPKSFDIDFLTDQGKGSSSDLYTRYIEYFNEQASIRVLGQTLTTNVGDVGSYAAAKVHDNVRQDILKSDMKLVEATVNSLIRRIVNMNMTSVQEYPVFCFTESENIDYQKAKLEIFKGLKELGYAMPQDTIEEVFEVELEEAPEQPEQPEQPPAEPEFSEKEADDEIQKLIEEIWRTQPKQTS